jgi:hypothetical protein
MRAVGFVPYLGAVTWVAGAAFGLGLMLTAVWRARSVAPSRTPWVVTKDVPGPT